MLKLLPTKKLDRLVDYIRLNPGKTMNEMEKSGARLGGNPLLWKLAYLELAGDVYREEGPGYGRWYATLGGSR